MDIAQIADTGRIIASRLFRLDFAGLRRLMRVNSLFEPDRIIDNFLSMQDIFETLPLPAATDPVAIPTAPRDIADEYQVGGRPYRLSDHIRDRNVTALLILKDGELVSEAYFRDTPEGAHRISWSMSKSVMSMLLGILIDKGLVPESALADNVAAHVPILRGSGYDGATLQNVLHMSSGVAFNEDYMDYHSDINRMGRIIGVGGSLDEFAASLTRQWPPGTYSHYVSIDTHVIGMVMRALTSQRMIDLLNTHFFEPLGLEHGGTIIADSTGEPFVLGGLNLSARDYVRIALMAANGGKLGKKRIVPAEWIDRSTCQSAPPPDPETAAKPDGSLGYGMQWWLLPDPEPGEFAAFGIYGQFLYINRDRGVVIVQNAADTGFRVGDGIVGVRSGFLFREIARSL